MRLASTTSSAAEDAVERGSCYKPIQFLSELVNGGDRSMVTWRG